MEQKITCYIANPSFGKSEKKDDLAIKQIENIVFYVRERGCNEIVICGGMYSFTKEQVNNFDYVKKEVEFVSKCFPLHLNINYKVLSGKTELMVLVKHQYNMNKELEKNRKDFKHLGYDRVELGNTLIKYNYGRQNNLGFNDGEFLNYKGHIYDPSARLSKIVKDFNGDLVLIGGSNRFEEFVYNNKIVIALPSIMNPNHSNKCPDIGFIMVDRTKELDVKQHVKILNKKPNFK